VSARPAKKDARGSGGYGERGRRPIRVGMRWRGDVCGWGSVYAGAIMAGVFVGKGLLSRVLTADQRCSKHRSRAYIDHSTRCRIPFSTYIPNLVTIS